MTGVTVCLLCLAILATVLWFGILVTRNLLPAIDFVQWAPMLVGAGVLLGVIPSGILYVRGHDKLDLVSLLVSASACVALLLELAVLWLAANVLRFGGPGG